MKKKLYEDNREIDLSKLLNIIWHGKIKILIAILISVSIGTFLNKSNEKPDTYFITLDIKPGKNSSYMNFASLVEVFSDYQINSNTVFGKFNEEFFDYEELIIALKKNAYVREQLSKTPKKDHQNILYKFVKLFSYKPALNPTNDDVLPYYTLSVNWHDFDDGRKIIDDTINLTLINLKKSIFYDLNYVLKMKKDTRVLQNLVRINYLQEQSAIAKELDIVNNQVDFVNMSQSSVSFNINSNDVAYYLRGFKAIDKEINLIQSRSYQDLAQIENSIRALEKLETEWINYNIFLASVETINDSNKKNYLMIFLILGLVIGMLYVFISNALQSQRFKTSKK